MDLLSYDDLLDKVVWSNMAMRRRNIYDMFIAAQCTQKTVDQVVDSLKPPNEIPQDDQAKFLADFRKLSQ